MPTVDFYLIPTHSDKERLDFACRLIEKIYKQQRRIYIHAENQKSAHLLDELLWTYREDSFLPHHLYGEGPEPVPPIQIGYDAEPKQHQDILINLSTTIPSFYKSFTRVLELISEDSAITIAGRTRYKQYRADLCPITTHKLETSTEV